MIPRLTVDAVKRGTGGRVRTGPVAARGDMTDGKPDGGCRKGVSVAENLNGPFKARENMSF